EVARGRLRSEQLSCPHVDRAARAVRLEVAATRARALTGDAVGDDHHVAELGPRTEQTPGEDDPAADAGPERQHHEVARAATRAELELRVGGAARVVLDLDRQPEPFLHLVAKRHIANR